MPPPGQNGRHFTDDMFKCIFMKVLNFDLNFTEFIRKGLNDNMVQVMTLRQTGNKPLPEPMTTQFTDTYMLQQ